MLLHGEVVMLTEFIKHIFPVLTKPRGSSSGSTQWPCRSLWLGKVKLFKTSARFRNCCSFPGLLEECPLTCRVWDGPILSFLVFVLTRSAQDFGGPTGSGSADTDIATLNDSLFDGSEVTTEIRGAASSAGDSAGSAA